MSLSSKTSTAALQLIIQLEAEQAQRTLKMFGSTMVVTSDIWEKGWKEIGNAANGGADANDAAARQMEANWRRAMETTCAQADKLLARLERISELHPDLKGLDTLKNQVQSLHGELNELSDKPFTIDIKTELRADKSSIEAEMAGARREIENMERSTKGMGGTVKTVFNDIQKSGMEMAGNLFVIQSALMVLEGAINATVARSFALEKALTGLQNRIGLTASEAQQAGRAISSAYGDSLGSLEDMSAAYELVAQKGYRGAEAADIYSAAIKRSSGMNIDAAETTTELVDLLHLFHINASQAIQTQDQWIVAQQRAGVSSEDWAGGVHEALAAASDLNLPLTQTLALLSSMTNYLGDASKAGDQFTNVINAIGNMSDETHEKLRALAYESGVTSLLGDANAGGLGDSSVGLQKIIVELTQAYENLGYSQDEAIEQAAKLLDVQEQELGLVAGLTSQNGTYADSLNALTAASSGTSAAELAHARAMDTVGGQWGLATQKLDTLLTKLGEAPGSMKDALSLLNRFFAGLNGFAAADAGNSGNLFNDIGQKLRDGLKATGEAWNHEELAQQAQASAIKLAQQQEYVQQVLAHAQSERADMLAITKGETDEQVASIRQRYDTIQRITAEMSSHAQTERSDDRGRTAWSDLVSGEVNNSVSQFKDQFLGQFNDLEPEVKAKIAQALNNGDLKEIAALSGKEIGSPAIFSLINTISNGLETKLGPEAGSKFRAAMADLFNQPLGDLKGLDAANLVADFNNSLLSSIQSTEPERFAAMQNMLAGGDLLGALITQSDINGKESAISTANGMINGIMEQGPAVVSAMSAQLQQLHQFIAEYGDFTGQDYIIQLVNGVAGQAPAVQQIIRWLADNEGPESKLLWSILGEASGKAYGDYLNAGVMAAELAGVSKLRATADSLRNMHSAWADSAALEADKSADALLASTKAKISAAITDWQKDGWIPTPPKVPKGPKPPTAAQLAGWESDVINVLRQAGQKIGPEAKSAADAILELLKVDEIKKIPPELQGVVANIRAALSEMEKSGDMAPKELHDKIVGWLTQIADAGGNFRQRLGAEAALTDISEGWTDDAAKLVAAADKYQAAIKKARNSTTDAMGSLGEKLLKPDSNPAEIWTSMLDLWDSASKSQLPGIVDFATGELDKLASGVSLTSGQIYTDMMNVWVSLAQDSDPYVRALAASNIAKLTAGQTEAMQKAHEDALSSMDSLAQDLTAPQRNPGSIMLTMLEFAEQASAAGWSDVATTSKEWYERIASGADVSFGEILASMSLHLDEMLTSSDPKLRAFALQFETTWDDMKETQKQAQQEMRTGFMGSFGSLMTDFTASARDIPQTIIDLYAAADAAEKAGQSDQAKTLRQYGDALKQDPANYDWIITKTLQILKLGGDQMDTVSWATQQKMTQNYEDGQAARLKVIQDGRVNLLQALGGLATTYDPKINVGQVLLDVESLSTALEEAGHGDWAIKLRADAQDVANGVPGALERMRADAMMYVTEMDDGSSAIFHAWHLKIVADAKAAADGVSAEFQRLQKAAQDDLLAAAQNYIKGQKALSEAHQQMNDDVAKHIEETKSAAQGLASSLGSLGKDLLDPGKTWLSSFASLAELAKQATAAGMPDVAAEIEAFIASGGEGGGAAMYANVIKWLEQLQQSSNPILRAMAADMEQQLAFAAAMRESQQAVDAWGDRIKAAQGVVSDYQQHVQDAQDALTKFSQAQLLGEGVFDDKLFANQQEQYALQLKIADLKSQGPAMGGQVAYYQEQLEQLRREAEILGLKQHVEFDPKHRTLDQVANPREEVAYGDALSGAEKAKTELDKYNPLLEGAQKHLAAMQAGEEAAREAMDALNDSFHNQTTALPEWGSAWGTNGPIAQGAMGEIWQGFGDAAKQGSLLFSMAQMDKAFAQQQSTLPTWAAQWGTMPGAIAPAMTGIRTEFDTLFGDRKQEGTLLFALTDHTTGFFTQFDQVTDTALTWNREEIWQSNMNLTRDKVVNFLLGEMKSDSATAARAAGLAAGQAYGQGWTDAIPAITAAAKAAGQAAARAAKEAGSGSGSDGNDDLLSLVRSVGY